MWPSITGLWLSTPDEHTVCCGLRILQRTINLQTLERIHQAAREHPFTSVAGLWIGVALTPLELERLIASGALDTLASTSGRCAGRHSWRRCQVLRKIPCMTSMSSLDLPVWCEKSVHIFYFT